jgi:hypothetical protein
MLTTPQSLNVAFQPLRISNSAEIILNAPVDVVYPLFGAIREREWAFGWEPEIIFSSSGDMELHMIFRTRSPLHEEHFIWTVTQHRSQDHLVEYLVTAQGRCWFVTVVCREGQDKTIATVTYSYTGFTVVGHQRNEAAMQKMFALNLSDWEEAINYYLATGRQLQ